MPRPTKISEINQYKKQCTAESILEYANSIEEVKNALKIYSSQYKEHKKELYSLVLEATANIEKAFELLSDPKTTDTQRAALMRSIFLMAELHGEVKLKRNNLLKNIVDMASNSVARRRFFDAMYDAYFFKGKILDLAPHFLEDEGKINVIGDSHQIYEAMKLAEIHNEANHTKMVREALFNIKIGDKTFAQIAAENPSKVRFILPSINGYVYIQILEFIKYRDSHSEKIVEPARKRYQDYVKMYLDSKKDITIEESLEDSNLIYEYNIFIYNARFKAAGIKLEDINPNLLSDYGIKAIFLSFKSSEIARDFIHKIKIENLDARIDEFDAMNPSHFITPSYFITTTQYLTKEQKHEMLQSFFKQYEDRGKKPGLEVPLQNLLKEFIKRDIATVDDIKRFAKSSSIRLHHLIEQESGPEYIKKILEAAISLDSEDFRGKEQHTQRVLHYIFFHKFRDVAAKLDVKMLVEILSKDLYVSNLKYDPIICIKSINATNIDQVDSNIFARRLQDSYVNATGHMSAKGKAGAISLLEHMHKTGVKFSKPNLTDLKKAQVQLQELQAQLKDVTSLEKVRLEEKIGRMERKIDKLSSSISPYLGTSPLEAVLNLPVNEINTQALAETKINVQDFIKFATKENEAAIVQILQNRMQGSPELNNEIRDILVVEHHNCKDQERTKLIGRIHSKCKAFTKTSDKKQDDKLSKDAEVVIKFALQYCVDHPRKTAVILDHATMGTISSSRNTNAALLTEGNIIAAVRGMNCEEQSKILDSLKFLMPKNQEFNSNFMSRILMKIQILFTELMFGKNTVISNFEKALKEAHPELQTSLQEAIEIATNNIEPDIIEAGKDAIAGLEAELDVEKSGRLLT